LGDILVNSKRQIEEVSYQLFIGEVDLGDVHRDLWGGMAKCPEGVSRRTANS
jgi:hypothetical protein